MSFSPDGKSLVFVELAPETGADLHLLSMEGEHSVEPLLATDSGEYLAEISPDGRWMAYQSDEAGRSEIYVHPFPNVEDGKVPISSRGGHSPMWGPQGRELFYLSVPSGDLMVVSYETEPTFTPESPEVLFSANYFSGTGRNYDIHPDGQRFLMIKPTEQTEEASAGQEIVVIQNWFEELKRLVPTE